MTNFQIAIGDRAIFQPYHWITIPPGFTLEFEDWMGTTFGMPGVKWYATSSGKKIRSNRGAGNLGGWETKPYWMYFHFFADADAIIFKMRWYESILFTTTE